MTTTFNAGTRKSHNNRSGIASAPPATIPLRRQLSPLSRSLQRLIAGVLASASGVLAAATIPTGGSVVGGTGSITTSSNTVTVNQTSSSLALNWASFNLSADATVAFVQPGAASVALNRILDSNPSQILGSITSNGQVFLINPNGIVFGSSAQLNVGGLVASTLDISPSDFMNRIYNLNANGAVASVINHGTILAASGGSVSLIGGNVLNDGLIVANQGQINLSGANMATLDFDGNGLFQVTINGTPLSQSGNGTAAVLNTGSLMAESGTVVLQAAAAPGLFTQLVNNSGVIDASSISNNGGVVSLIASGGDLATGGTINVSGANAGSVQLSSDKNVNVTAAITATDAASGGSISASGSSITLDSALNAGAGQINLTSTGAITQNTGSTLTAGTLSGSSTGATTLSGTNNAITALGSFSAADFSLTNSQALVVTGAIDASRTTLNTNSGDLTINGTITSTTTTLNSAGAINQGTNGVISTGTLTGGAAGSTNLTGANQVSTLSNFSSGGDFNLNNTQTLTVGASPVVNGGQGNITLSTTGAASDLLLTTDLSGTTITLGAGRNITQSAGIIAANTLTGSSTGSTTLNNLNQIGTLQNFSANGLSVTNGQALTVAGAVNGGNATTLQTTAGDLAINGAVSGTTTTLTAAGAISGGINGSLTAATLTGSAVGPTVLGTAAQPMHNHVGILGGFSSPAGFSFTNNQTLTLAAVGNSLFTVDAGTSALYLSVLNGDLLQTGTTPLYDGVGTFAASGKIGTASTPLYVIGSGMQTVANVGQTPTYFYAVNRQGSPVPFNGQASVNLAAPNVTPPTPNVTPPVADTQTPGLSAALAPAVIAANYRLFDAAPLSINESVESTDCQSGQDDCSDK